MITISNEPPCSKGSEYLVCYKNNEKITPLCVLFPKMSVYVPNVDDAKTIFLLIEDEELLKKYNKI